MQNISSDALINILGLKHIENLIAVGLFLMPTMVLAGTMFPVKLNGSCYTIAN